MTLDKLAKMKASAKIHIRPKENLGSYRPVELVSLGCHVKGVSLPHPCSYDTDTMVAGVIKRFTFAPPVPDRVLLRKMKVFTKRWIRKNLTRIAADADTSVEGWLSRTNYPEWRKQELREKWAEVKDITDPLKRYFECNSFMKDEVYPSLKHARAINSRTDEFKCAVGPIFKLMEDKVYSHPAFIKHVPVKDRPAYISERLYRTGAKYAATDYTAFESLFTKELMMSCEFQLYKYLVRDLPEGKSFMDLIEASIAGNNR